nr:MAG TPA: hypothetical protein [Caudoviricetes sp.]
MDTTIPAVYLIYFLIYDNNQKYIFRGDHIGDGDNRS